MLLPRRWRRIGGGLAAVALAGCFMVGDISAKEAHRLVREGARLVDVRTPAEYAEGHIDGAVNIPIDELDRRVTEVGDKRRPVVLYCRSGYRSSKGVKLLKRAGFTKVYNLGPRSRW